MNPLFDEVRSLAKELSVLYVEDETTIRENMVKILSNLFSEVKSAEDGEQGLARYMETSFDIVITDIRMPHLDGISMLKKIKEHNPDQHIIITSAYSDTRYFTDAIEAGVDGFIIKPLKIDQFFVTLKKSCQYIHESKSNVAYRNHLEKLVEERSRQIEKQLVTDDLTGLPNSIRLKKELAAGLYKSVLVINMDNFDHLNSIYGYDAGDQVLADLASFFKTYENERYTLYRIGGDEFAFLSAEDDRQSVEAFAEQLVKALYEYNIDMEDIQFNPTCTIGIATNHEGHALRNAHIALKEARQIGKNRFSYYTGSSMLEEKNRQNIACMRHIKEALQDDMVIPFFQPIVNNTSGKVEKYECLARIKNMEQVVTPDRFIEPAKLVGLLSQITRTMVEKSFAYMQEKPYAFSLNLSSQDFNEGYVVEFLQRSARRYNIDPNRVVIEVLEEISVEGSDRVLAQLRELKRIGFKIALDDFGSEKSNFSRLQKMEVDFIKIDGAFIKDLDTNEQSRKITRTITHLAKDLNAQVIAEFVHSKAIWEIVKACGIEYSQGYYFGEPSMMLSEEPDSPKAGA